jgi:predicted dehydrogenase
MTTMAPIRIGIVGLSAKAGAWAALAHLPRLVSSPNFEIVAMCNSTIESTKAAIKAHGLPESVKAYSSYDDLAADPNVDLFVVSTRVDSHWEIVMPALKAKRNVFVEWPLAVSTEEAKKIASFAKEQGVKTMIGFQARASPSVQKIKEIVDSGVLGEIHSVNYQGVINNWQNNLADERYSHFLQRAVGANPLTIYGAHTLDAILFAVGELKEGSYTPLAVNLRLKMQMQRSDGTVTTEFLDKDTPDQILLHGQLDRQPPAVLSFHLRAGARFVGAPGSTWRIFGTRGELVVEFTSAGPQMAKALSLRLCNFENKTVEDIEVDEGGCEWTSLPNQGQNLGHLYEAYFAGEAYGDFDLAVKRHELLDEFWASMR